MSALPSTARSLVIKTTKKRPPVFHDVAIVENALPPLNSGEVLVKISAAAFNHRDLWMRKGLYPGIVNGAVMGADGAGTVVAAAKPSDPLLNKRVFLTPMRGWKSDPEAPDGPFTILGGGPVQGTFTDYVVVEREEVVPSPSHLDDVQVAAWPLAGLTAWRAAVVNGRVSEGTNVLITGIGGGVALTALQICIARGANVFVTSGSPDKIQKAVELGAKGGANYKDKDWPAQIGKLVNQKGRSDQPKLDCVIDAGGGDLMNQIGRVLKLGGRVVCYGMHAKPTITMTMLHVMANHQLIGSTMGSLVDMHAATKFLAEKKFIPVVSHVLKGLEGTDKGFELLENAQQFGKIVVSLENAKTKL